MGGGVPGPMKTARIQLRLRELAQLFNSMDPSPFLDRDLDADAEEFIMSWAREHPQDHELELSIHLATVPPPDRAAGIQEAVHHYFALRRQMKRHEFQQLMRRGWRSLLIGLTFLTGCLFLSEFSGRFGDGTGANILREGLTIIGWVAMWRPLEIYLYNWWPVWDEQRLLARLTRMHVHLVLPAETKP
jgi:hypothetical protein